MKPNELLEIGDRKKIYTVTFSSTNEIENNLGAIVAVIEEANRLDN